MGILKSLNYVSPTLVQSMYIFKSNKLGKGLDPHSDNSFLFTNPISGSTLAVWVALDDATIVEFNNKFL